MGLELKTGPKNKQILSVYGEVGLDFNAKDFQEALASIPEGDKIEVRIHSPGGDYFEGIAIHTNLARRNVDVVVDGEAASAGSIIAMAGQKIEMAEGAWMMIHEVHGTLRGQPVDEFRRAIDRMEDTNTQMVGIYSKRWKGDENSLRKAMRAETWFTAGDAMNAGLADGVAQGVKLAAHSDLSKFAYANVPEALQKKEITRPQYVLDGIAAVERLLEGKSVA